MPWPWEREKFRKPYLPYTEHRIGELPDPERIAAGLDTLLRSSVEHPSPGVVVLVFDRTDRDKPEDFADGIAKTAAVLISQRYVVAPDMQMQDISQELPPVPPYVATDTPVASYVHKLTPQSVRKAIDAKKLYGQMDHRQIVTAVARNRNTLEISSIDPDPRQMIIYTHKIPLDRPQQSREKRGWGRSPGGGLLFRGAR